MALKHKDGTEGTAKEILFSSDTDGTAIWDNINSLDVDASPIGSTDYIITWDASALAHKKVLLNNLPTGGNVTVDNDGTPLTTSVSSIDFNSGLTATEPVADNIEVNVEINGLTADATPDGATDYVMTYDASATGLKKVLLNNLPSGGGADLTVDNDGTPLTTAAVSIDFNSGLTATEPVADNIEVNVDINGLTADATPDGAADYVMTYDASATGLKKVLLNNLPSGGGGGGDLWSDPVDASIVPDTTSTYNLGSSTLTFNNIHNEEQFFYDSSSNEIAKMETAGNYWQVSLTEVSPSYNDEVRIGSASQATSQVLGTLRLGLGDTTSNTSGAKGAVLLHTGEQDDAYSGPPTLLDIYTGISTDTSQNTVQNRTGTIRAWTGNIIKTDSQAKTGDISLYTGSADGNATTGDSAVSSGDINLITGAPSGTGLKGHINLDGKKIYNNIITTTNNTETDILNIPVSLGTTGYINVKVVGSTDDGGYHVYEAKAAFRHTIPTSMLKLVGGDEWTNTNQSSTEASATVVSTNPNIRIRVKGVTSESWSWRATCEYVEPNCLRTFQELKRIQNPNEEADDHFGGCIDHDSDRIIIGAEWDDGSTEAISNAGEAYIFYKDEGGTDNWGLKKTLNKPSETSTDYFGDSVAIDGTTAVVAAPSHDGTNSDDGEVYIYYKDEGGTDNWGLKKTLTNPNSEAFDKFGGIENNGIDIDGDYIIIGCYADDGSTEAISNAGEAYIYYRNEGGTDNWGLKKTLNAPTETASDFFGMSVAIDGTTAVVGASGEDIGAGSGLGAGFVYYKDEGGTDNWGHKATVNDIDEYDSEDFGKTIDISGDYMVLGSYTADGMGDDVSASGNAIIFGRNIGGTDNWGFVKKLGPPTFDYDPDSGWQLNGYYDINQEFARSVSMEGDWLAIGCPGYSATQEKGYSGSTYDLGRVFVYHKNQGGEGNWGLVEEVSSPDEDSADEFGEAVHITSTGLLFACSYDDDGTGDLTSNAGEAYVMEFKV